MNAPGPCPDWRRLLEQRAARGGDEPAGWREAIAHLDGCSRCRDQAPALDPLLLLRRLPPVAIEPDEGRRMVAAVRALERRAEASRDRRRWWAAAALTLAAGGLWSARIVERDPLPVVRALPAEAARVPREPALVRPAAAPGLLLPAPAGVEIDSAAARVYELSDAAVDLVVVVDQGLQLRSRS